MTKKTSSLIGLTSSKGFARPTKKTVSLSVFAGLFIGFMWLMIFSTFTACTGPNALMHAQTNYTSEEVIPVVTNTVYVPVTNTVTINEVVTNNVTGAVTVNPLTVMTIQTNGYTTITYQTNKYFNVSYVPTTNAQEMANAGGSIANMFAPGTGGLVAKGIMGVLTIGGGIFAHKYKQSGDVITQVKATAKDNLNKVAASLSQGIETYREVVKTTPQGAAVDAKLVAWLQSHQQATGVIDIIGTVVKNNVNNYAAQQIASDIVDSVNVLAAPASPASPVAASPRTSI